jgi:hypothetical protein
MISKRARALPRSSTLCSGSCACLITKLQIKDHGIDMDRDREFVYFDVPVPLNFDDVDVRVHNGHVLIRMVRQEQPHGSFA